LTRFKVNIVRSPKTGTLRKALEKYDLQGKWDNSSVAKRIALRAKRARLNDFDRFTAMVTKRRVN